MADIFISYAREDTRLIAPVAEAVGSSGWTVWWDPHMVPGVNFRDAILNELNAAKCVLVMWSQISCNSHWVCEEAREAVARNKFLPVLIDVDKPPFGFGFFHACDLRKWDGTTSSTQFHALVKGIRRHLEIASPPSTEPQSGQTNEAPTEPPSQRPGSESRATFAPADSAVIATFSVSEFVSKFGRTIPQAKAALLQGDTKLEVYAAGQSLPLFASLLGGRNRVYLIDLAPRSIKIVLSLPSAVGSDPFTGSIHLQSAVDNPEELIRRFGSHIDPTREYTLALMEVLSSYTIRRTPSEVNALNEELPKLSGVRLVEGMRISRYVSHIVSDLALQQRAKVDAYPAPDKSPSERSNATDKEQFIRRFTASLQAIRSLDVAQRGEHLRQHLELLDTMVQNGLIDQREAELFLVPKMQAALGGGNQLPPLLSPPPSGK